MEKTTNGIVNGLSAYNNLSLEPAEHLKECESLSDYQKNTKPKQADEDISRIILNI